MAENALTVSGRVDSLPDQFRNRRWPAQRDNICPPSDFAAILKRLGTLAPSPHRSQPLALLVIADPNVQAFAVIYARRVFGRALLRSVACCYALRSHPRADKSMVDFKRLFDTSMTAGHASQCRHQIPDHRIARERGVLGAHHSHRYRHDKAIWSA